MIHVLTLFPAADDASALERYLEERMLPAMQDTPGVRSVSRSRGPLMSPAGPAPYAHVVTSVFGSMGDVVAFGQSSATEAVRKEGEGFGALILMFEAEEL